MMRDWSELKKWAENLQNCPETYDMPAEVVRLVMDDLLALIAENEQLQKDKSRLDWFDGMNKALNAHYGTEYRWKVVVNHNVNRIYLNSLRIIDMNDQDCHGLPSCRDAIDAAMKGPSND